MAASKKPQDQSSESWHAEDKWWNENFGNRPYVQQGLGYDYYRPAYEYGFESARHNLGRDWDEVEPDLRTGWQKRYPAKSTWEDIKDAVRDAWNRVTGHQDLDTRKMADSNIARGSTK